MRAALESRGAEFYETDHQIDSYSVSPHPAASLSKVINSNPSTLGSTCRTGLIGPIHHPTPLRHQRVTARHLAPIRLAQARERPVGRTTLERGAGERHRWRTWPF